MRSVNIRYIPGLDHLRACAVLLIVFYHALQILSFWPQVGPENVFSVWISSANPLIALIEEGHTAVALFIVLSGFIFSVGAHGKEVRYGAFVKNRLLRIYPLYFAILVAAIALSSESYEFLAVLRSLALLGNLPGAVDIPPYTAMFWAVALEFQLYLVFPFLHRTVSRKGLRWIGVMIAVAVLLRWTAILNEANIRDLTYWTLLGRFDQFLIGIGAGFVHSRGGLKPSIPRFVGALALVLFAIVLFNLAGGWPVSEPWKILWPPIEAFAWALVVLTYIPVSCRLPSLMGKLLTWVGVMSYSIFLFHLAMLDIIASAVSYRFPLEPNLQSQVFALVFVLPPLFAISALSFYAIERPFLRMRGKYLEDPAPAA